MPPKKNKLNKTTGSGKENLHRLQSRDLMKTTEAYVHNVMRKSHNLIQTKQAQLKGIMPSQLIPEGKKDHYTPASLDNAITNLRESIQMVSQDQKEKSFLDAGMYSSNVMKSILGADDTKSSLDVGIGPFIGDQNVSSNNFISLTLPSAEYGNPADLQAPIPSPSPKRSLSPKHRFQSHHADSTNHQHQSVDFGSLRNEKNVLEETNAVIYNTHFSGLESFGASGMTILDELIDKALQACERGSSERGACALAPNGKVYTGCDVYVSPSQDGLSAERASILAAVADGIKTFDCIVIAVSSDDNFPFPDGRSREFLRSFGIFPVILVNSKLEAKHTSTQELFPSPVSANSNTQQPLSPNRKSHSDNPASPMRAILRGDTCAPGDFRDDGDSDLSTWSVERVKEWLVNNDFETLVDTFFKHKVDGLLLVEINERFCVDVLQIPNPLIRRKLVRRIELLKKKSVDAYKEKTFDELDEYVMMLETHRIKLVAKLKAIFDKFDRKQSGSIGGQEVEQLLIYMDRPIDSDDVNHWINHLKDKDLTVDFADFVGKYSSFFSGIDPDVPVGEGDTPSPPVEKHDEKLKERGIKSRDEERENWDDNMSEHSDDRRRDKNDIPSHVVSTKELLDVKALAELKSIFDRFAVNDKMTAPETCQALHEAGCMAPRREFAAYLRGRKHLGTNRSINFFEFLRAFAAVRGPLGVKQKSRRNELPENEDWRRKQRRLGERNIDDYDDRDGLARARRVGLNGRFKVGEGVEARYRGREVFVPGEIVKDRGDDSYDIEYDNGYFETRVDETLIRRTDKSSTLKSGYHSSRFRERDGSRSRRSRSRSRSPTGQSFFREGEKVEARYRSKEKYYVGRIKRDREDGTFDIDYDNGETEYRVKSNLIKSLEKRYHSRSRFHDHSRSRSPVYRGRSRHSSRHRSRSSSRSRSRDRKAGPFKGDRVEVRYRGRSKWYPAKISKERSDGTFDVEYDDGDSEMRVKEDFIKITDRRSRSRSRSRSPRSRSTVDTILREGDAVEANYRGRGKYYTGKIRQDRGDGTYDIDYDDGERETRVRENLIAPARSSSSKPDNGRYISTSYCEGDRVEVNFRGRGKYHPGRIKSDNRDGTFDVDYDDGDKERGVHGDLIRSLSSSSPRRDNTSAPKFRQGDRVEGNYRGKGNFHPGKIGFDYRDGTYDIDYDDGDKESRVRAELIRPISSRVGTSSRSDSHAHELVVGARVETRDGRYEEKGIIRRDNYDGTFDVEFDNGSNGRNIRGSEIRVIDRPGSPSHVRQTRFRDID